jgi:16S rRNA (adenine1518-N6/adenine1519-N6)-dimethyltransferase
MAESEIITKKSMGQHWLHDEASLQAMVEAADVTTGETVLEIGPGTGNLTAKLLEAGATVTAVERDKHLFQDLTNRFSGQRLYLHTNDILRFDLTSLSRNYKVVANIPYYLTSNLLRVLCESANPPASITLLVQKEVAERVAAAPGRMSLLSVSVQFYCRASLGLIIPARYFTPPPKVDSQVLKLNRHKSPLFPDIDTKDFFRVVKAGFSSRRKTLLNSLSAGLRLSKEQIASALDESGLNPGNRAQELSMTDWHRLYSVLTDSGKV